MAEIFDIDDLRILDRYARKEGYTGLAEYLPAIRAWNLSIDTAAECVRKGISFSDYKDDPTLLEEALPEGVIDIYALYRERDKRIAQEKARALETRIAQTQQTTPQKPKENPFKTVMYGIIAGSIAASALIGLSSLPQKHLESALLNDPLCTSIESMYICLDNTEQGQSFGSYREYKNLREGL